MLPDLDRLIRLQRLDNASVEARRTIEAIPTRMAELDAQLDASRKKVDEAKQHLADQKQVRQTVEKVLAETQAKLSRFKEQLMAVKTNKEYTAVQHEIAAAEAHANKLEDDIIEHMVQADELTAAVSSTEQVEQKDRSDVELARTKLEMERAEIEQQLTGTSSEREKLASDLSEATLRLFDSIARQRQGLAVVEARDGHCTVCNVRLRPQVFNQILLNTDLVRCDSCMRILYHDPDNTHRNLSTGDTPK